MLIDQFEELFTDCRDERDAFIDILSGLPAFGSLRTHILATLRSDFLGDLFRYRDLYELASRVSTCARWSEEELKESIELPLRIKAEHRARIGERRGSLVLAGARARAAEDATYLPLLQTSLEELWRSGHLTLPPTATWA